MQEITWQSSGMFGRTWWSMTTIPILQPNSVIFFVRGTYTVFNFPEQKAYVSFPIAGCPSSVCLSIDFSHVHFLLKTLCLIQPNFTQSILVWGRFNIVQTKRYVLCQGEIITKKLWIELYSCFPKVKNIYQRLLACLHLLTSILIFPQENIRKKVYHCLWGLFGKKSRMGNWLNLFYVSNYLLVKSYVIVGTETSEV